MFAVVLAIAALIVAIVAFTHKATTLSYPVTQRADAKTEPCDRYKPAMDAVHIETNATDVGLARIAVVNGALILAGATANPASDPDYRDAARAVVKGYEDLVVESSRGRTGDPRFDSVLNAVTTKGCAQKELRGD